MDLGLKGKAALVTGATSGMGLGIAKVLAEEGCNLMITGFGEAKEIERLKAEIAGRHGVKVLHDPANLAQADQVVQMVRNTEKAYGAVDILVNNAGIQHVALVEDFPADRWDALLAVNLTAAFHAIRTAIPGMKKRGWGRIINNASASGLAASPKKTAYTAAKFGLIGLTKAVALETAELRITCNAICPGWVLSGMSRPQIEVIAQREGVSFEEASKILLSSQPNKRFITPEEIGRFVAYLCSDAAAPITGAALSIDGGIMAG